MEATLTDETQRIRLLASRVEGLPALPIMASKLLEVVDDPKASAADMAALISTDPALATRLLKLANSAYYGFPRRIGTVNLAVVVLGLETVRDLCLSVLITDCFFKGESNATFDMNGFWKHSMYTAVCTRLIYKMAGARHPGEGFITGLVHDIGKLFLGRYFPVEYNEVIATVEEEEFPLLEAEQQHFGVTHPTAGSWLLAEWNLPNWLVEAARDHHGSSSGGENVKLSCSVAFSDLLVRRKYQDEGGPGQVNEITPEMIQVLNMKKDVSGKPDFDIYNAKLEGEIDKAQGFMEAITKPG
ncbi:hypothetical protein CEE37_00810 [candidate division LCP-89 bacterium B3_LCP]|uniref:HDOD domain-containing protein n=1 Tax=candidate division LCP-89 bacterium B3_LCP TaxID=2012998 RepID=A0A532V4X9_UNCL8|nr:MAG: hypothetical protein CEE37_00810 [candidate division LCP-89 bacterium B3_LCP]